MTHTVSWTISQSWIYGEVTCQASEGSACRLGCPFGCESWHCGHELVDQGECHALPWLHEDYLWTSYEGETTTVRDAPIEVRWTGDEYAWRYVDRPTEDRTCSNNLSSPAERGR